MDDQDSSTKLELLLIAFEYAIADVEHEIECEATVGHVANVAQIRSKLASLRYAVELGLNLLFDFGRCAA